MLVGMPSQPRTPKPANQPAGKRCRALTTGGAQCGLPAVAGLTVCRAHGGATAASVSKSKRARVATQAVALWGITVDAGSISVAEELTKLARNKLTDVTALRLKISQDAITKHIGTLTEQETLTEYDIEGTVQSKSGTQETKTRRATTSIWVQELHRTEQELIVILKLLQEVSGNTEEVDIRRIRMQTAQEAARLTKAFPGISVDEVANEIGKKAS